MFKTIIEVKNLKRLGCARSIKLSLLQIPGTKNILVELDKNIVTIIHSKPKILDAVRIQLKKIGYPPSSIENQLSDKARSIVSCMWGKMLLD